MTTRNLPALVAVVLLLGCCATAHAWFASAAAFRDLCWSPDGRRLCFGVHSSVEGDAEAEMGNDLIAIVTIDSPSVRCLLPAGHAPHPNPLGNRLALAAISGLYLLDLERGTLIQLAQPFTPYVEPDRYAIDNIAWSQDGNSLVFSTWRDYECYSELYLVRLPDHKSLRELASGIINTCGRVLSLRWIGQDEIALCCGQSQTDSTFFRINVATNTVQRIDPDEYATRPTPRAVVRLARDTIVTAWVTKDLHDGVYDEKTRLVHDTLLDYVIVVEFPDGVARAFRPAIVGITGVTGEVSADGKLVYFEWSREGPNVESWGVTRNAPKFYWLGRGSYQGIGPVTPPVWLKGGNRLLYYDAHNYGTVNTDGTGSVIPVRDSIVSVTLSPDSNRVALELQDQFGFSVGVAHLESTRYTRVADVRSPLWLAGGSRLLCRSADGFVLLSNTGQLLARVPFTANGHAPFWIADSIILFRSGTTQRCWDGGSSEMVGDESDPVWQFNLLSSKLAPATQELADRYHARQSPSRDTLTSPNGRLIAWIEQKKETSRVWLSNADGTNRRLLVDAWSNYTHNLDLDDPTSGGE